MIGTRFHFILEAGRNAIAGTLYFPGVSLEMLHDERPFDKAGLSSLNATKSVKIMEDALARDLGEFVKDGGEKVIIGHPNVTIMLIDEGACFFEGIRLHKETMKCMPY